MSAASQKAKTLKRRRQALMMNLAPGCLRRFNVRQASPAKAM
jgi:hypothetical protein